MVSTKWAYERAQGLSALRIGPGWFIAGPGSRYGAISGVELYGKEYSSGHAPTPV